MDSLFALSFVVLQDKFVSCSTGVDKKYSAFAPRQYTRTRARAKITSLPATQSSSDYKTTEGPPIPCGYNADLGCCESAEPYQSELALLQFIL